MGEQSRRVERRAGHLGVDSHVEGYMELATVQNSTLTYTHTHTTSLVFQYEWALNVFSWYVLAEESSVQLPVLLHNEIYFYKFRFVNMFEPIMGQGKSG